MIRKKYAVYAKRSTDYEFSYMGSSVANSKEEAIRNVQYQNGFIGKGGNYSPFDDAWFYAEWKAI